MLEPHLCLVSVKQTCVVCQVVEVLVKFSSDISWDEGVEEVDRQVVLKRIEDFPTHSQKAECL